MSPMTIAEFIRTHVDEIVVKWEAFARTIPGAHHMDGAALQDHAKGIFLTITADLYRAQTSTEKDMKAKGKAPIAIQESEATVHGNTRLTTNRVAHGGGNFKKCLPVSSHWRASASCCHCGNTTAESEHPQHTCPWRSLKRPARKTEGQDLEADARMPMSSVFLRDQQRMQIMTQIKLALGARSSITQLEPRSPRVGASRNRMMLHSSSYGMFMRMRDGCGQIEIQT